MLRRCPVMSGYEAWLIADAAVAGERHEVESRRTGIGDQRSEWRERCRCFGRTVFQ